jgi:hypothetical protein
MAQLAKPGSDLAALKALPVRNAAHLGVGA